MFVFAVVILTIVRWVDSVARLGRLATTIDLVEKAARSALFKRRATPRLHGTAVTSTAGRPVFSPTIGYVQRVDVTALQTCAEAMECRIRVAALPGTFAFPERPLAWIVCADEESGEPECTEVAKAFMVGTESMRNAATRHARLALARAEREMNLPEDVSILRELARFAEQQHTP